MEQFILKSPEFLAEYNCSFYSVDAIPLEQRTHTVIGWSFILLFTVSELLYVLMLCIMWRKEFYSKPCYKIMFFMGVNDVFCLFTAGLFTGYFAINGFVYCSAPELIYLVGSSGLALWFIQSAFGVVLALNRCIEMFNPAINHDLFAGNKAYFWIIGVTVYGVALGCFSRPPLFSGVYVSWFFNPHMDYYPDTQYKYKNMFHTVHNMAILVCQMGCYCAFFVLLCRKAKSNFSSSLKESCTQVLIICMFNTIAAGAFVYMQFFYCPKWLILIGEYNWFMTHAGPAFIYCIFNRSIRKRAYKLFSGKSNAISSVAYKISPSVNLKS